MRKVLINNRGEIAVRVARACRDLGIRSVAVYTNADRDAPHVRMADEAYLLGDGSNDPKRGFLSVGQVLSIARAAKADAIHPGYGFAAEDAGFAQAVLDAGLVWIGPSPRAMRELGDKARVRKIAQKVGAPLAPGTVDPVLSVDDVIEFARSFGLPVAIKAVLGGGGRGLRVVHSLDEVGGRFASAVREATAAFGNGSCVVERFLDRVRHVETQCLADGFGSVVVVSTRDCSLQRRHQKLIEEAPAPFLSRDQQERLYNASKEILREVGYVGAATCEFLVDVEGAISFLEVNTRIQVEHPVTEEITGLDLICEQFRLADGEQMGFDDPTPRGHAVEFRINCEDPARGFLPAQGQITGWNPPGGPGVRVDSGLTRGSWIGPHFDSLLAKLIVRGSDRGQALRRAVRALRECEVSGVPTTLPFHRAVVAHPAFAATEPDRFEVHTRWVETAFDGLLGSGDIEAPEVAADQGSGGTDVLRHRVTFEIDGRRVEVGVPASLFGGGNPLLTSPVRATPKNRSRGAVVDMMTTRRPDTRIKASPDAVTSPMQGIVAQLAVTEGEHITKGALVAVLEAMKMEQPLYAHRDGTVTELAINAGMAVQYGAVLCRIVD